MERANLLRGALSLLPLLPVALVPGTGPIFGFAIVLLCLAVFRDARSAVFCMLHGTWRRSVLIGVVVGTVAGFAFPFVVEPAIEALTGKGVNYENFAGVRGNVKAYLSLLAIGIVVGGLLEELVFRGFVIGWGAQNFGERWGPLLVVVSASLFGFAHLYQGVSGMISTGLMGAIFGFTYLYANRKLLVPMVAHMMVNVIGVTLIFVGFD